MPKIYCVLTDRIPLSGQVLFIHATCDDRYSLHVRVGPQATASPRRRPPPHWDAVPLPGVATTLTLGAATKRADEEDLPPMRPLGTNGVVSPESGGSDSFADLDVS